MRMRNKEISKGEGFLKTSNKEIENIYNSYKMRKQYNTNIQLVSMLDMQKSIEIADKFEELRHNSTDKKTLKAYKALIEELKEQFLEIKKNGYKVEPFEWEWEPYKTSKEMRDDLKNNKHLYYLRTRYWFWNQRRNKKYIYTKEEILNNPLLWNSWIKIKGEELVYNDLFRIIHDFFWHWIKTNWFWPLWEENAWRIHSQSFSDDARRALTTETRGQNSWVNFNKKMRNKDGHILKKWDKWYIPPSDRPFAEQKIWLLPDEIVFPERFIWESN